jgi:Asp/Glu/hydantoin racemase
MLGILTLDTAFPRIRGDVGCAATFDFPVRYATVEGAGPEAIVHRASDEALPAFVRAAQDLVADGCIGIATTCGFLVRWQRDLATAVPVPVLTSSLLAVPLIERLLPPQRSVGVVTYSAESLSAATLEAAGASPGTPVEGVDPMGCFARTIRLGAAGIDRGRMEADVVDAARRLVARRGEVGAILLECANMPPYRDAVAEATGLPVFDAAQLVTAFYRGLEGSRPRRPRDLW